jgi:outer membrane immunogenic protein
MRQLLFGITAIAALAVTPAVAADILPLKAPPTLVSWTGCYVAGGIGYGMWNQDSHSESYPGLVALEDVNYTGGGRGWLGRAGVGCDYQAGSSFVIGAFADYDWSNIHGGFQDLLTGVVGDENLSHSWAAGGRIGYLVYPSLMTFISAGFTQAHYNSVSLAIPSGANTPILGFGAHDYNGWFLGTGYEYRLPWFSSLSWKTEYRFSEFQAADLPVYDVPSGAPSGFAEHNEKYVQTVTTSLVWRFNFGGPIATRY